MVHSEVIFPNIAKRIARKTLQIHFGKGKTVSGRQTKVLNHIVEPGLLIRPGPIAPEDFISGKNRRRGLKNEFILLKTPQIVLHISLPHRTLQIVQLELFPWPILSPMLRCQYAKNFSVRFCVALKPMISGPVFHR